MPGARSPSTVDLAAAAAQALRELNYRTLHSAALTGPAQLDRIVADLAVMVAGLPQLLRQLGQWLAVASRDIGDTPGLLVAGMREGPLGEV